MHRPDEKTLSTFPSLDLLSPQITASLLAFFQVVHFLDAGRNFPDHMAAGLPGIENLKTPRILQR